MRGTACFSLCCFKKCLESQCAGMLLWYIFNLYRLGKAVFERIGEEKNELPRKQAKSDRKN